MAGQVAPWDNFDMRAAAMIVMLLASVAAGDPSRTPDPTLITRGRVLAAAGKHRDAIGLYERYLAAAPDDTTANAELGWSAFQLKDYARAEAATRRAIANSQPPSYRGDPTGNARGGALYNLGLILEARARRADAVEALVSSLAARPSRVVRDKLVELDAARAAAVDRIAPQPLAGPFSSPTDKCEDCRGTAVIPKLVLQKPFEAIELRYTSIAIVVAVRVGGRWYRSELESEPICMQTADPRTFVVDRTALVTRGKQLQLELDYKTSVQCSRLSGGHDNAWNVATRGTLVIGVGRSGKPSAPPGFPLGASVDHRLDGEPSAGAFTYAATLRWSSDGVAKLDGTVLGGWGSPDELGKEDWLGLHVLAFP